MKTTAKTGAVAKTTVIEWGSCGRAVPVRATKREATKIAALKLSGVRNAADARVLGAKAMRIAARVLEAQTIDGSVFATVGRDMVNYVVFEACRDADLAMIERLLADAVHVEEA